MTTTPHHPSKQLYNRIAGAFRFHGTTFTTWCKKVGVPRGSAISAARGLWHGPKATKMVARLVKASKLEKIGITKNGADA